jgi:hypothetical protein
MRWFASTGKAAELKSELEFAGGLIEKLEGPGSAPAPVTLMGMHTAVTLYEASRQDRTVRDELRRWCAEDWGRAVPVHILTKRLARIGVWLPK